MARGSNDPPIGPITQPGQKARIGGGKRVTFQFGGGDPSEGGTPQGLRLVLPPTAKKRTRDRQFSPRIREPKPGRFPPPRLRYSVPPSIPRAKHWGKLSSGFRFATGKLPQTAQMSRRITLGDEQTSLTKDQSRRHFETRFVRRHARHGAAGKRCGGKGKPPRASSSDTLVNEPHLFHFLEVKQVASVKKESDESGRRARAVNQAS